MGELMDSELFKAAMVGNVKFLHEANNSPSEYLLRKTSQENNIIHIAATHNQSGSADFIKEALERFPVLVNQKNVEKNTPLHVATYYGNIAAVEAILVNVSDAANLWSIKNKNDDTPLHLALRKQRDADWVGFILTKAHLQTCSELNKSNESPLHLYVRHYCCDVSQHHNEQAIGEQIRALIHHANKSVACIKDMEGLTPLLRAATNGCLLAVRIIIEACPETIEVCDVEGRIFLHLISHVEYQEFKDLLDIDLINTIKNREDNEGNTSMHLAVQRHDFVALRALLECSVDPMIKNKKGVSAFDIIQSETTFSEKLMEIRNNIQRNKVMDKELIMAIEKGDLTPLNEKGFKNEDIYFFSRTWDGNNIIHLAIQNDQREWVEKALQQFPNLIYQVNNSGENPLHTAAKVGNSAAAIIVRSVPDCHRKVIEGIHKLMHPINPLMMKNSRGNSPLHEAVCGGIHFNFVLDLINSAPEAISIRNSNGETPLHLFAKFGVFIPVVDDMTKVLGKLVKKSGSSMYLRDRDGFTPLLRAAMSGNIDLVRAIWKKYPQAMQLRDTKGRTFLHLMDLSKIKPNPKEIFEKVEIDALRAVQDDEGNTPLHYAIISGKFKIAKILMRRSVEDVDCRELHLANKHGEKIETLLTHDDVPNELIYVYRKKNRSYTSNYELRSSYGITRKQIKERADSLSVIAALLATITFAAGITVPGGLNQEIGIPIFVRNTAFKTFILLDALAMCGSMLVLYYLVWVMIGTKSESFLLIDMSITLLQLSFVATILAFGVGVFVTTYREAKWLAILVCVLCVLITPLLFRSVLFYFNRFLIRHVVPRVHRLLPKFSDKVNIFKNVLTHKSQVGS